MLNYLIWLFFILNDSVLNKFILNEKSSFEQALEKLNILPHSYVHELWPESTKFGPNRLGDSNNNELLKRCYSDRMGNDVEKSIDIFEWTVLDIVHNYFILNNELINSFNLVERVEIFLKNIEKLIDLVRHCMNQPKHKQSKLGLTSISALSYQEYLKSLGNFSDFKKTLKLGDDAQACKYSANLPKIPRKLDWRAMKVVAPVKNQRFCGSCYIFSAVATIESHYMIQKNMTGIVLSEQEWLNCIPNGCDGGFASIVYDAVIQNKGLSSQSEIPYSGIKSVCHHREVKASMVSYCYEEGFLSDKHIESLLYNYGPVSAAIDASNWQWQFCIGLYTGTCGQSLNHAITIVGFEPKYWIIKNSWGSMWGSKGYFKLVRRFNRCGINIIRAIPYITDDQIKNGS